ncbi:MAG: ATP-binding protein [Candidatus Margulisbacteria bacterium]|jgi:PAS domain S-box-containing protein|nr:ATP-binding protein [Candidatus Margulisiibacteriota bacterium]
MKLDNRDLEKIEAILRDAVLAADTPLIFIALKREDSPQFEVKFAVPQALPKGNELVFLSSVNQFVEKVISAKEGDFASSIAEGAKNLLTVYDIETAARPVSVKAFGLCPVVINKEVQALVFFAARLADIKVLKTINAFAWQIAALFEIRECQRIAHDANQKSQTLAEASSDAFFTIDTQTSHVHVSHNLQELTGYEPAEFIKGLVNPEEYVVPEDLSKVRDFYRDAFAGKKVEVEFKMKRKDGNLIWFSIFSNPIFDSNGKLIAIQGVGKDISENKKSTWELEKTREREQMKTEFMSVISHELRTPLTPIQGYTEMLLSEQIGKLNPEQRTAIDTIKKQSRRLLSLIDSVLDITRVEYGRPIEIKKGPVSLNAVIDDAVGIMEFQLQEKGIKPVIEHSPEIDTLLADESKLARVISNLLGNALKFTPNKGHVSITISKTGGVAQVEVADSGIGIAKEDLERIFEKFVQVDSSYTRSAGGIGMGLTIVREIVEAHGGKVWAQSDGLGHGAKFIFTLPLS